jgi:hypothetical protein
MSQALRLRGALQRPPYLPFQCLVLGFRKLRDVFTGILGRDELAPAGQRDRTIEASRSALGRHRANLSAPAAVNFTF